MALRSTSRTPYEKPTPAGLSMRSKLELRHQLLLLRANPVSPMSYPMITGPKPAKVRKIEAPPGPPFIYMIIGSSDLFLSDSIKR